MQIAWETYYLKTKYIFNLIIALEFRNSEEFGKVIDLTLTYIA